MNYFELINKCLVELNYKQVRNFNELIKNDHEKIKNIMNIINAEVCGFDNWPFLLRRKYLFLPKNTSEIFNSVKGKISTLLIDDIKYDYYDDYEKFILNNQPSAKYGTFNDKLLFPKFDADKNIDVIYYTSNYAKSADGEDKPFMHLETDVSVIPEPFVETILVYGTCMRLKANPQYSKFNYWFGMYKDALATLRSKAGISAHENPTITLIRE